MVTSSKHLFNAVPELSGALEEIVGAAKHMAFPKGLVGGYRGTDGVMIVFSLDDWLVRAEAALAVSRGELKS